MRPSCGAVDAITTGGRLVSTSNASIGFSASWEERHRNGGELGAESREGKL